VSLAARPTSNMDDQELISVCNPLFDLSGMNNAMKSLCSRQHRSQGHCGAPNSPARPRERNFFFYVGENYWYFFYCFIMTI
jgi:hypothetical protein